MATTKSDDELLSDVTALSSGAYLGAKDVKDGELTFAVQYAAIETFASKDGKKGGERRLVLNLEGDPVRKLSLNETNRAVLVDAWGKDARLWGGPSFVIDCFFDASVRSPSGTRTGGLRVKVRRPARTATPKPNGAETVVAERDDDPNDAIPF
jgi:hypothetical protein